MHAAPVPGVLVSVRFAAFLILDGYEDFPCAGAGLADFDAVKLPAAEPLAQRNNSAAVLVTQSVMPPLLLPPAERRRAAPVPVALVPVCCVVRFPVWFARLPRVAVVGLMFGAVAQAAPAVTAPGFLYGAFDRKSCAEVERLHGQFRGQSFLPARSRYALRCPNGRAALRCRSAPLRIFAPSGAGE